MQVVCPRCAQVLEYSQAAPRFCSHCGQSLSSSVDTIPAPPPTSKQDSPTLLADVPLADQATRAYPVRAGGGDPFGQPDVVGNYRLLRPLGAGGMGTVYEAEEQTSGRRVALKLIRQEFADSRDAVERFRREGRLASSLFHPRCVFVFAADEDHGRPYIVMELMPGKTLQDQVGESGPLAITTAVARALDLIDGLQEAHRLGFVHRDVKPSNCFLDAEGRVKVGDFGLAKALVGPEQLTRSGSFLGTVLFASPEQIRNEPVTPQTDIYSVCATLYYLLTGRAPFEDEDPAAALAKAVSDPPQSMRRFRPEIPRTLDEIVLRGLARSRRVRWQTLEDLRLALIPFVDRSQCVAEVGWRATAYLIDVLLLTPIELIIQNVLPGSDWDASSVFVSFIAGLICGLVYFAIPEWLLGYSPGKFLLRLRVRDLRTGDRPAPLQSLLRTLSFYFFRDTPALAAVLLLILAQGRLIPGGESDMAARVVLTLISLALLPFLTGLVGFGVLALPMRRNSGYRGLHDLLSGTWVIRLPAARPALRMPAKLDCSGLGAADGSLPDRIGGYVVQGILRRTSDELLVRAEDTALGRPVWLWLRRAESSPLPAARRDVARPGRPRWLAHGELDHWVWDAFIGAPGCSLSDLVSRRRRLSWREALVILEQLAAELEAAESDQSLPERLSPEQIWVQTSGRVLLLDAPLREPHRVETARDLLRQAAAVVLEGQPRRPEALTEPIRAPIPWHAAELMARVVGKEEAFGSLSEIHQAFTAAHQLPEEITRPGRALQVGLTTVCLLPGLLFLYMLGPALMALSYYICVVGAAMGQLSLEQAEACLHTEEQGMADPVVLRELRADRDRVLEELTQLSRDRLIVLSSWSWFVHNRVANFEQPLREDYTDRFRRFLEGEEELEGLDLELAQGDYPVAGPSTMIQALNEEWHPAGLMFAVPLLWALWSAVTRGGIVLHLAGITLVDSQGRAAARWRCALRTLLVWLPIVVLLAAALWLDLWRVGTARDNWSLEAIQLAGSLSWHFWWAAVLLLIGYIFAAIYWPNRGLHDILSGVYPVPR